MPTDLLTHTPTPAQVRASREAAGLSMDAAAALVGLPGRGAWWRMETETVHQRPIDPRLWALWLLATDQHPGYRAMPTRRGGVHAGPVAADGAAGGGGAAAVVPGGA